MAAMRTWVGPLAAFNGRITVMLQYGVIRAISLRIRKEMRGGRPDFPDRLRGEPAFDERRSLAENRDQGASGADLSGNAPDRRGPRVTPASIAESGASRPFPQRG